MGIPCLSQNTVNSLRAGALSYSHFYSQELQKFWHNIDAQLMFVEWMNEQGQTHPLGATTRVSMAI
jgi:hypothetical protein